VRGDVQLAICLLVVQCRITSLALILITASPTQWLDPSVEDRQHSLLSPFPFPLPFPLPLP